MENVPADGNCMFSCLAIGLSRATSTAQDVRNEIIQFIRDNLNEVRPMVYCRIIWTMHCFSGLFIHAYNGLSSACAADVNYTLLSNPYNPSRLIHLPA